MTRSAVLQSGRPLRVFLAEADARLRRLIAAALRRDGHQVIESQDGTALLLDVGGAYLHGEEPNRPGLVIADAQMPGRDGLAVLRNLSRQSWSPPVMLLSGVADPELQAQATRLGALAVLDKPFAVEQLCAAVRAYAVSLAQQPPRGPDTL